ncbi:hypothetical protein [Neolewinella agarilytica]|uniref:Uncharacterized protein n=1 Tax=Neolewinella agarilytica TaxID=478744 RepID=A0A1H9K113_9BACT|nr:hypothetical protein [Neolewinella agarilytica]SEQ92802.1 hypothetical protein SAMN05444359_11936 [Neolewinella agarilytica]
MPEFWTNLSYTTRFSAIGFVATFILGFISMGMLGAVLYYPVSFVLRGYPWIDDLHGDWMWPAVIMIGMGWSFSFLFAGAAWHFLAPSIDSVVILRIIYGLILWAWAAFLWWWILYSQA